MKTRTNEPWRDRCVRAIFGIPGPLDEYARQELGRISTNILAFIAVVQLIGLGVAMSISARYGDAAAFNTLVSIILLSLLGALGFYGTRSLSRAQLTQREVSAADYARVRRYQLHRTFWTTIVSTAGYGLLNWLWSSGESLAHLTVSDWLQLIIFAIGFFIVLYVNNVLSIKRYTE